MKNRQKIAGIYASLWTVLCCFILISCAGSGELIVEKHNSVQKNQVKKMVVIEPDYSLVKLAKRANRKYLKNSSKEKQFGELLKKNGERNKINVVLKDANSLGAAETDYFNYLIPLKREILAANFRQKAEYGETKAQTAFKEGYLELTESPVFSSKFSHLSEKYGTPYFSVQGVLSVIKPHKLKANLFIIPQAVNALINPKVESLFYNIVVNVNSGEVVYREARVFNTLATDDDLSLIIYDSFQILRQK